ncbi:hypothetical protein [Paenibacillus sp. NEAU-GSW1]|nr:hypothetical protein [Paenibacillus sp. NEAU-GSW1]MUT67175.1 hypothetical protein [Paenibacillus sp. NEAU-GSW1]
MRSIRVELSAVPGLSFAAYVLQIDVFPGKHEISGRIAYDWLRDQLR